MISFPWQANTQGPASGPLTFTVDPLTGSAPAGASLVAGALSAGRIGIHSIVVTSTAPSGGTGPYTYQWQYLWVRGRAGWRNATGPGVTTLSAVIKNLGPSATYQIRLVVSDSAGHVAYSSVLSFYTRHLNWFPGLLRQRYR